MKERIEIGILFCIVIVAVLCLALIAKVLGVEFMASLFGTLIILIIYRRRLARELQLFWGWLRNTLKKLLGLTLAQKLKEQYARTRPIEDKVRLANRMFGLPDENEVIQRRLMAKFDPEKSLRRINSLLKKNQARRVTFDERLALLILIKNHLPTSPEYLCRWGVSKAAIVQLESWGWIEKYHHNSAYYVLTNDGEFAAWNQLEKNSINYEAANLNYPANHPELYPPKDDSKADSSS